MNKRYTIEVAHIIKIVVDTDQGIDEAKGRAISLANNGLRKVGPDEIGVNVKGVQTQNESGDWVFGDD